jgi:hypothetical protein
MNSKEHGVRLPTSSLNAKTTIISILKLLIKSLERQNNLQWITEALTSYIRYHTTI